MRRRRRGQRIHSSLSVAYTCMHRMRRKKNEKKKRTEKTQQRERGLHWCMGGWVVTAGHSCRLPQQLISSQEAAQDAQVPLAGCKLLKHLKVDIGVVKHGIHAAQQGVISEHDDSN